MVSKILWAIIIILAIYSGMVISKYDTNLSIIVSHYKITTTIFVFVIIIGICFLFIEECLRLISRILRWPIEIIGILQKTIYGDVRTQLLASYAYTITQQKENTKKALGRLKNIDDKLQEHYDILSSQILYGEDRVYHLKKLSKHEKFRTYAIEQLSEYYYQNKLYNHALEYASSLLEIKPDLHIAMMCAQIYVEIGMWDKFREILHRLEKFNDVAQKRSIAKYCLMAAKVVPHSTKFYLEQALVYDPTLMEAIHLLCSLNKPARRWRHHLKQVEAVNQHELEGNNTASSKYEQNKTKQEKSNKKQTQVESIKKGIHVDEGELEYEQTQHSKRMEEEQQAQAENLAILDAAFREAPSFAIFEMYKAYTDLERQEIFDRLIELVDEIKQYSLFLAIAADLELPHELSRLISMKERV